MTSLLVWYSSSRKALPDDLTLDVVLIFMEIGVEIIFNKGTSTCTLPFQNLSGIRLFNLAYVRNI